MLDRVAEFLDALTGVEGSTGYVIILVLVVSGYLWTSAWMVSPDRLVQKPPVEAKKEEEEADPPRNFTTTQLRYFDGKKDPKSDEDKPVYLSLNGTVFDVSAGRDFYGPEGPYEKFAGRECGVALAKMSFEETHLDDLKGVESLNFGEKTQLDEWFEKFKYYRCYPVKGRLVPDSVLPSSDRYLTKDDLAKNKGDAKEIPEGYAAAPIYVAAGDKVYDMSFGGVVHYGKDGPYNKFAGHDVSRALATMSLDEENILNSDTSDLSEKQLNVLKDWVKTFEERKGYPIVGKMRNE